MATLNKKTSLALLISLLIAGAAIAGGGENGPSDNNNDDKPKTVSRLTPPPDQDETPTSTQSLSSSNANTEEKFIGDGNFGTPQTPPTAPDTQPIKTVDELEEDLRRLELENQIAQLRKEKVEAEARTLELQKKLEEQDARKLAEQQKASPPAPTPTQKEEKDAMDRIGKKVEKQTKRFVKHLKKGKF